MELRAARNVGRKTPKQGRGTDVLPPVIPKPAAEEEASREGPYHSITVRYDALLYDTLQNMIRSSHTAQDFTYPSLADFVRAALTAYKNGMVLTEIDQGGSKLETSLRVNRELWLFYKSLPGRMRSKILERAIRTFMKHPPAQPGRSPHRAGGESGSKKHK
jgi:hypothetical protein